MTNWMTAVGIAFIAGGLATLISLRSVLFNADKSGGKARDVRRTAKPDRSSRQPAAAVPARRAARGRRARRDQRPDAGNPRAAAVDLAETAALDIPAGALDDPPPGTRRDPRGDQRPDDHPGGLASIGLADDEDYDLTGDPPGVPADDPADHPADGLGDDPADGLGDDPADDLGDGLGYGLGEPDEADAPVGPQPAGEPATCGTGVRGGPIASYAPIIPAHRSAPDRPVPDRPAAPDPVPAEDEQCRPLPVRPVDRSDRGYGDRVDGWVRPQYHEEPGESPAGEYWTPVPMDDIDFALTRDDPEPSAKGYGWPIRVERLPAVPDYEPATGFDLLPVATEPTEVVPVWPPVPDRRVRLPRSWGSRNQKPADNRFTENETAPRRRTEPDERFRAPAGEPERRRPRPRPRPGPDAENVYVSRHAAEPPR